MKTPSFAHKIGESALAGVGRNNICATSSIWNGFGKAWKHQVLHTKSENLQWQGWAGIIFVNIFYLKWLWEGMKTPSFAHEIGESALAGVGRNLQYMWISSIWNGFGKAWKHQVLHMKLENHCTGVGRNNICAYLLFEMALGRHENTKFCTRNWRICTGRGGQE